MNLYFYRCTLHLIFELVIDRYSYFCLYVILVFGLCVYRKPYERWAYCLRVNKFVVMHKQTENEIKIRIVADIRKTVCINAFVSMENKHLRSNSQRKKKRYIYIEREKSKCICQSVDIFSLNSGHSTHIPHNNICVERF